MELIFDAATKFFDFLDGLFFFFFSPMSEVASHSLAWVGAADGTLVNTVLEKVFNWLFALNPSFSDMSFATLFIGGGIVFVLVLRFIIWIVDVIN